MVFEFSTIVEWEDFSCVVLLVLFDLVGQMSDHGIWDWSDGNLGVVKVGLIVWGWVSFRCKSGWDKSTRSNGQRSKLGVWFQIHNELKVSSYEWRDVKNDILGVMQTHWCLTSNTISNTLVCDTPKWSIRRTARFSSTFGFISSTISIWTSQRSIFGATVEMWAIDSANSVFTSWGAFDTFTDELKSEVTFFLGGTTNTILTKVRLIKVFATSEWWAVVLLFSARSITT